MPHLESKTKLIITAGVNWYINPLKKMCYLCKNITIMMVNLEELSNKHLTHIQNTYYDMYAASNKQFSFVQMDKVGNMISVVFLKETEH